jgi:hypothetical protein
MKIASPLHLLFTSGLLTTLNTSILPALSGPPAHVDFMPSEERFKEEARPCVHGTVSAQPAPGGTGWLPLDCLTVSATKGATTLVTEAAGFSVRGQESFTVHSLRPLFSIGLKCSGPAGGRPLKITLLQRGPTNTAPVEADRGVVYSGELTPTGDAGGFYHVWSDTAFNMVEVTSADDLPVTWTAIMTGCLPRLKTPPTFGGTNDKRYDFFRRSLATSASGPLGVEPRLPQPQSTDPKGSGTFLRYGSVGIRGAGGTTLGLGDDAMLTRLRAGHPLYDQTLGLLAGVEMASNTGTGEDFDVCLDTPATAFGFDIVEVMNKPAGVTDDEFKLLTGNAILKQSTFTITLFHGTRQVGDPFKFEPVDNVAAFWGVLSAQPFTRVEIRETEGSNDNELFGQFYTTPCVCCCGEKPSAK